MDRLKVFCMLTAVATAPLAEDAFLSPLYNFGLFDKNQLSIGVALLLGL